MNLTPDGTWRHRISRGLTRPSTQSFTFYWIGDSDESIGELSNSVLVLSKEDLSTNLLLSIPPRLPRVNHQTLEIRPALQKLQEQPYEWNNPLCVRERWLEQIDSLVADVLKNTLPFAMFCHCYESSTRASRFPNASPGFCNRLAMDVTILLSHANRTNKDRPRPIGLPREGFQATTSLEKNTFVSLDFWVVVPVLLNLPRLVDWPKI